MKRTTLFFIAFVLILPVFFSVPAQTKQPLTEKDLEKFTYYFDIVDGRFTGGGSKFLADEIGRNQYILLGEYHGSLRISEFTKALIPVFHAAGCRTFGLEVGPISSQELTSFSKDPERIVENLNSFNSKYLMARGQREFTPIPFFSNVEDAEFLIEAAKRKWKLIGLDQEFSFSYLPLIERTYENLTASGKSKLSSLYVQTIAAVKNIYAEDASGVKNQYIAISESIEFNKFLDLASGKNAQNKEIADALRMTTGIYKNNASTIRKYYAANSTRVDYMKQNLAAGFAKNAFDVKKDKMLLKMGAVHTGRGFSPLSLFEIGNNLSELADFHGNRSLHLNFHSRFYVEGGKEIDALENKTGFDYRFQSLLQMGKRDQWTVIDLRPLREAVFYHRRFSMDDIVLEIFKNHDLFVIPKLEKDPTPNYQKK